MKYGAARKYLRWLWGLQKRSVVWLLNNTARTSREPVIIFGNQKSGTTAIAALLAECVGASVTLDVPDIYRTYTGDMSFEEFFRRNKYLFSRDILKEPSFVLLYPELKRVFPAAKFLMIVRDPRDNIRSILNRLNIRGDLENIDPDIPLGRAHPAWRTLLDGRWLGLQGDTYIEMLAARWNYAADVYLAHSDEIVLLRYEAFLADKAGTIEKLAYQLGLTPLNDISDKVDIQFQPRGNGEISWDAFFGQKNLMRIEQICGSRMEDLRLR